MNYTCPTCGQTASCWSPQIYKGILPPLPGLGASHELQLQNIRDMLETIGLTTVLEAVEEIKRLRAAADSGPRAT